MPPKKYVQATVTFRAVMKDNPRRWVRQGELLPASDPVVKHAPNLFVDADEVVEQATAAPGEKRTTRKKRV